MENFGWVISNVDDETESRIYLLFTLFELIILQISVIAVNKIKTEVCLFYKHACRPVFITLDGTRIESKSVINVLV
jgi:hypothetical protein